MLAAAAGHEQDTAGMLANGELLPDSCILVQVARMLLVSGANTAAEVVCCTVVPVVSTHPISPVTDVRLVAA